MIDRIQRFFQNRLAAGPGLDERQQDERLRLATAALFIEMTRADFEIKEEERAAVSDAVQRVLGVSAHEADELIALADQEVQDSVSLFQFTQLVNRGFAPEQKKRIVELLWRIAMADDEVESHEEHLVRKVAGLLHVHHRDFIDAKRRAREAAKS